MAHIREKHLLSEYIGYINLIANYGVFYYLAAPIYGIFALIMDASITEFSRQFRLLLVWRKMQNGDCGGNYKQ